MAQAGSYAEVVRMAMKTVKNRTGKPLTLRQIEKAIGYSYEHIRKVTVGLPVGSREFNDRLCTFLGLDKDEMWELAMREKAVYRFGVNPFRQLPDDARLKELWPKLTEADRRRIIVIAEGYAMANEELAKRNEPTKRRSA